jgi:hypothetical protein
MTGHKEINRRLNMENGYLHSVQHSHVSFIKTGSVKIKIIISSGILYVCKTWSLSLREEHRLRVFEIKMSWNIHEQRKEYEDEANQIQIYSLYSASSIISH